MGNQYFLTPVSQHIWETRYRFHSEDVTESSIEETWRRVARSLASVEPVDQPFWEEKFYSVLEGFKFLPAGRIQTGAGTDLRVTLFNCFVMDTIHDSMDGIFDALKQGALTMQQGGGVGYDFSTLRPAGSTARKSGTFASGPVSFMRIWDAMCATLLSTGVRRGAMMATLRCDHPDIEAFISAKQDKTSLRHFNLSILVSDEFMQAVDKDLDWALVFPVKSIKTGNNDEFIERRWSGGTAPVKCVVVKKIRARALWENIMRATYEYAEPGVLFVDRINELNNLYYREHISATNPCGEIPLPPYGACDLGSINLTRFIKNPFTKQAYMDMEGIRETAAIATRMLDNVIDASNFPLPQQQEQALGSRRIGLGITGLADAFIMMGFHYGDKNSLQFAKEAMALVCHTAYRTSIDISKQKGVFPFLDKDKYIQSVFVQSLTEDIQQGIAEFGIRNSHLVAIAPTGTISLLANNVSSGLEPVFDLEYTRRVLEADGSYTTYEMQDYAVMQWRRNNSEALPDIFRQQTCLSPDTHLEMQAVLQHYVDNAISKTINIPEGFSFDAFKDIYRKAYTKGLKGCTTFRPNPVTGEILTGGEEFEKGHQCCGIERETD